MLIENTFSPFSSAHYLEEPTISVVFYKNVSETQQIMKEILSCDPAAEVYLGCINNEKQKMLEKSQMHFGGLSV